MKHIAAGEAKNKFGQLLDMAQRAPITIDKKGRPVAVVLSLEDYERLEQLEDQLWALQGIAAGKEGFLSEKESQQFMDEL